MQTTKRIKAGLADLKRLRQQAEAGSEPSPRPNKRKPRATASGRKPRAGSSAHDPASPQSAPTERPHIAADDIELFRRAVANVQRLAPPNTTLLPPIPVAPPSVLRQKRQAASGGEMAQPPDVSDGFASALLALDGTHFLQLGCGPDLLKKLRQGKWRVEATLDLHGATLEQARTRLDGFLSSCLQHQLRCVRVVHGKGYGSKGNAPVLKETVRRWLSQLADVMAFVECEERDGGTGAVLVLLRANTTRPANDRRPC